MLPFRMTSESEKQQLQQLNSRLLQYLSRTKQLEQENVHLIREINQLRQVKGRDPGYKDEMRDLRRLVEQLSFEKSQAEIERQKLLRELQMVQTLCGEQTGVCRDISGELKGCEKELHHMHKTNSELQQRLLQLEKECKGLEDAHRQEMDHLRHQVESRAVPIITQTYHGPPGASVEGVQEYARGMSEGWIETFEMYQQKVDEMEQSIRVDQLMLGDLQRERMMYVSELDKLRTDAERQGQIQMHLEEQLMHMQETFQVDCGEYQRIIEQLERERNIMADTIAGKMQEHQRLLQLKMDLGMEVASYRALLEGERVGQHDAQRRISQQRGERVIDIRMPAQRYTPRGSTLTTRQHMDTIYTQPTTNLRRSPVPPSGPRSPSRVIPISVAGMARHQSPASRRDMISFTKAQKARSTPPTTTTAKENQTGQRKKQTSPNELKTSGFEKMVEITQVSHVENQASPILSSTTEGRSIRVVSPPMMSLSMETETESEEQVSDEKEKKVKDEDKTHPGDKKILDSVSVEEIMENVIKPAGLEAKVCSPGDSKVRYHVVKTEQEDGTTKTNIVLESKVEGEIDMCEYSAVDGILNQELKKVLPEDIKDTEKGSSIKNLLSDLQGHEDFENKSVNIEIIEEPVESQSDEEPEVEKKSRSSFYEPSSTYFQIEEIGTNRHDAQFQRSEGDAVITYMTDADHSKGGSVRVEEVSRESETSDFSHDQEAREYFVSTPDGNLSEAEECGGITSYGHYGIFDDLSDERYYQDEDLPLGRVTVEESDEYKYTSGDHPFNIESFQECIYEEEVCVSPVVQESVLELLREDSLEPKEQLKSALEKLQDSVSGPLREELAFLAKVSCESPENVAVDVKKVQQSSDNDTMTIVAEMIVSQTLEDSGLLETDVISEEQIFGALRSSTPGLGRAFQSGPGGEYSFRVSKEEDITHGGEGFAKEGESATEISEKHIQLGPSENSFTFNMDIQGGLAEAASQQDLQSQIFETPVRISQEKRIVYLESPTDD